MRKAFLALVLSAALLFSLSGCGGFLNLFGGDKTGSIGAEMKTEWFAFVVESAKIVPEYEGYTPESGNMLIDVVVTETNTFDSTLPMFDSDFVLQDSSESFVFSLDPFHGSMMPLEFDLAVGETVTYHVVFEVPDSSSGFSLVYLEEYTDTTGNEGTGSTFTVELGI